MRIQGILALCCLLHAFEEPVLAAELRRRFPAADQTAVSAVTVNAAGQIFACGTTLRAAAIPKALRLGPISSGESTNSGGHSPTVTAGDAFLIKLASNGDVISAVVWGGSGPDQGMKLGLDAAGNVVVAGVTQSPQFPNPSGPGPGTVPAPDGFRRLFISKFDASATNLLFTRFFGGNDALTALAVDRNGNAIFAGETGLPEAFGFTRPADTGRVSVWSYVAKLAADGSTLSYVRSFGEGFGISRIQALVTDANGHVYLTGNTASHHLSTTNALQPIRPAFNRTAAFLARIDPGGEMVFSTYLAGETWETGNAIALDPDGKILVGGITASERIPADLLALRTSAAPARQRAFVLEVDPMGRGVLRSNFFPTEIDGPVAGLVSLSNGRVVLAGSTSSTVPVPLFGVVSPGGFPSTRLDPLHRKTWAQFNAFVAGPDGNAYASGVEFAGSQSSGWFIAAYSSEDLAPPTVPEVRLMDPVQDVTYPPKTPLQVRALIAGHTGAVRSVTFQSGRRSIGIVTNEPYSMIWSNVPRGAYVVSAVADLDGQQVISPPVAVTFASPRNDLFARRVRLTGSSFDLQGKTDGGTTEPGEINDGGRSVWYSWTSTADGPVEITLEADPNDQWSLQAGLFTGNRLDQLLSFNAPVLSPGQSSAFQARRGVEYVFRVWSNAYGPAPGAFRLRLQSITPPANDDFRHAVVLSGERVTSLASLRHATLEAGEYFGGSGTVWYEWTAPISGEFLAAAPAPGSVGVVRGLSVSNLFAAGPSIWGATNGTTFAAERGVTYRIAVAGNGLAEVRWSLGRVTPPANDSFLDRLTIPPGLTSVTGTLIGASFDPGDPSLRYPLPSVWWTWRPTAPGRYLFSTRSLVNPSPSDGVTRFIPSRNETVGVYAIDGWGLLQPVSAGQTGYIPRPIQVSPETNYLIAVSGYQAWFALDLTPVIAPENDSFDAATPLAGAVVGADGTLIWATLETGEPNRTNSFPLPGGQPSGPAASSVWYRWTAPSDGEYAISMNYGTLGVYVGDQVSQLTTVSSNAQHHRFLATGGVEYRLQVVDSSYLGSSDFSFQIRPALPPANDDFAHRQPLDPSPAPWIPTVVDASSEPGEPTHWSGSNRSIWYSWRAPSTGTCQWVVEGGSPPAIYTGDTLSNLVAVPVLLGARGYEFVATAGTIYQIAINTEPFFYFGSVPALELSYLPAPGNDNFANRAALRGRRVDVIGSNVGATREPEEPPVLPGASGRTVWWTWRAPDDGSVAFLLDQADPNSWTTYFDGELAVFAGGSLITLTNIADPVTHVRVQAGRDYQIAVDSRATGRSGRFRVKIAYHPAASNDDFADRRPFDGSIHGTLLGSTIEPEEPAQGWPFPGTLWWSWTPRVSGFYDLNFQSWDPSGRSPGALAAEFFKGETLPELEPVAQITPYDPIGMNPLRFEAQAGTPYAIRISGSAWPFKFKLTATYRPPPANDAFARRLPLRGTNVTVVGSNETATSDSDEFEAAPDVWWTWTAPIRGAAHVKVAVENPYTCQAISVYRGSALEELELIGDSLDEFTFPVEPGQPYQIAVRSAGCYPAGGRFQLTLTAHGPPANDNFADRIPVAGSNVLVSDARLWGASAEPGDPTYPTSSGASVWWQWTAPVSGRYTFTNITALFTGSSLNTLTLIATNPPAASSLNVPLTAGAEVVILIDHDPSLAPERWTWGLGRTDRPPNDDFANRTVVTGDRVLGTLEGSSWEITDPFSLDPSGTSIWWSLNPTNTGWRRIVMNRPEWGRAFLQLFRGTNARELEWIVPSSEPSIGTGYFHLEAGVTYALEVAGINGWFGPVDLSILDIRTASNDWFTNAAPEAGTNVFMMADNRLCSLEPSEQAHPSGADNSVWWRWTAPAPGVYSITRSNSPSLAFVDVYTGTALANLTRVPETVYGREFGESLFRAEGGITYFIAGTTPATDHGVMQLRLLSAPPPANDDFANGTILSGAHVTARVSNINATAEPGDPVAGQLGQQTVWWRWTAPTAGRVTVNVTGNDGSRRGGLFRGDRVTALTTIVGPDQSWPKEFIAESGVEYFVGATTWSDWPGPIDLAIDLSPAAAEAPLQPVIPSASRAAGSMLTLASPDPQRRWIIESSTNLVEWTPLVTNSVGTTHYPLSAGPADPVRFFRSRRE